MSAQRPGYEGEAHPARRSHTWARLYQRAAVALRQHLGTRGELSPRRVAEAVAAALPELVGRQLLRSLARRGWLDAEARIPFDVLDGPDCPADLGGGVRELARLALFGPGGQGIPADAKHREAIFQQVCADIMRETRDLQSLQQAGTRAMNHPDVQRDPLLAGMVRSFLNEREADFKMQQRDQQAGPRFGSQLRRAFGDRDAPRGPTKAQVQATFQRLRHEFDDQVAQFEESASHAALVQMRSLRERRPEHVEQSDLQECEDRYAKLVARCDVYRQQINELARQAMTAARSGDQKTAAWTLRRLSAVHKMRPMLLPANHLAALREKIVHAGAEHDQREAAQALMSRERAVAAEIKKLGEIIDRYHKAAEQLAHDDPRYVRIQEQYRQAVAEIRSHDTEWLAELMIELDELVEDLEDTTGQAETQVSRFIATVRTALGRLRREIETIQHGPPGSDTSP